MANVFFETFENLLTYKLEPILGSMREFDEFSVVYSSVVSFASNANNELFMEVMNHINDTNFIRSAFMTFYYDSLQVHFNEIRAQKNGQVDDWIDACAERFAYDLKNCILSSVTKSIEAVDKLQMQKLKVESVKDNLTVEADEFDWYSSEDEEDEITPEFLHQSEATKHHTILSSEEEQSIIDDIHRNSCRSTSPKPSSDLSLAASALLIYGIDSKHFLFPEVKNYLEILNFHNLKSYDPRELLHDRRLAYDFGFNLDTSTFQEFCNFVGSSELPITSPLYKASRVSKPMILKEKRAVLMQLAVEEMHILNDTLDHTKIYEQITSKNRETGTNNDEDVIELIIYHVKGQIATFLFSFDIKNHLTNGLDAVITEAFNEVSSTIQLASLGTLFEIIKESIEKHFQSPLALVKNYEILEEWTEHYDEKSPSFRGVSLTPKSSSPDRKSVTILEELNNVVLIQRISDILDEDDAKRTPKMKEISRSPSVTSNLENLVEIDKENAQPALIDFSDEESKESFDLLADFEFIDFDSVSLPAPAPQETGKYSATEVPDFPYDDPLKVIMDPVYIKATSDYYRQNGDDNCFMLDERVTSMKEGLSIFLSESFVDPEVVESLKKIIGISIDSSFKP